MILRRLAPNTGLTWLAWLLLIAMVFLGFTITQQQTLGSLHRHTGLEPRNTFVFTAVSGLADDWKARRQQQEISGHGQLLLGTSFDPSRWSEKHSRMAHSFQAHDAHDHDSLERHHHAPSDGTVVALDGAADAVDAIDSSAHGASMLLPVIGTPSDALTLQAIAGDRCCWLVAGLVAFTSRNIPPPLRPPTV